MFCTAGHRVFRSFRSHKHIRSTEHRQQHGNVEEQPREHRRQPSEASSIATITSDASRSSACQTEMSIDFDPLRCHPPLQTACASHPPSRLNPRQHHFSDDEVSGSIPHTIPIQACSSHQPQAPCQVSNKIHEGFNFRFDPKSAKSVSDGYCARELKSNWSYSTLSLATTESDFGPDDSEDSYRVGTATETEPEWGTALRPRPQPSALDTPEYIMKRGAWKRRGIVFVPVPIVSMASEDCFTLP